METKPSPADLYGTQSSPICPHRRKVALKGSEVQVLIRILLSYSSRWAIYVDVETIKSYWFRVHKNEIQCSEIRLESTSFLASSKEEKNKNCSSIKKLEIPNGLGANFSIKAFEP
jgi:hypothetical protein